MLTYCNFSTFPISVDVPAGNSVIKDFFNDSADSYNLAVNPTFRQPIFRKEDITARICGSVALGPAVVLGVSTKEFGVTASARLDLPRVDLCVALAQSEQLPMNRILLLSNRDHQTLIVNAPMGVLSQRHFSCPPHSGSASEHPLSTWSVSSRRPLLLHLKHYTKRGRSNKCVSVSVAAVTKVIRSSPLVRQQTEANQSLAPFRFQLTVPLAVTALLVNMIVQVLRLCLAVSLVATLLCSVSTPPDGHVAMVNRVSYLRELFVLGE